MAYLGIDKIDNSDMKIMYREAARAIIIQENKILLIHSNMGDYKFPGGGVEENENNMDGLMREVAEETGYINCAVKDKFGVVIEKRLDEYEQNAYFQMTSHYYLCELTNDEKIDQQLDEYEYEQEYTPKWLTIDEAIIENEKAMKQYEKNKWITRENLVLKELKEFYN